MKNAPSFYRKHLDATMRWLARSQRSDGGFSASYSYLKGWSLPYPETTGYIIETVLRYSLIDTGNDWASVARKASYWLLDLELPAGGFPAGYANSGEPRVFNTGMILFGLSSAYKWFGDERFGESGLRTLSWLRDIQNPDGSWTTASLEGKPHTYHSRVAWGILEMAKAINEVDQFLPVVISANNWVMEQQNDDGWFECNELIDGLPPLTHNIAYTIRGLLECGVQMGNQVWIGSAKLAAEAVYQDWKSSGRLPAGYWSGWRRGPGFRCVTGDAQFGGIWFRLWQVTREKKWLDAAAGIAEQVANIQSIRHPIPGARGGVPGAWPIWERYLRFAYPNWAAKFFADLLIFLLEVK